MVRKFFGVAAAVLVFGLASGASAQQGVSLANGSTDFTSWTLFGGASAPNNTPSELQLTHANVASSSGAGFAPAALTIDFNQAFKFDFSFQIIAGTVLRGDGLTFTLAGTPGPGGAGSGLGYEGLTSSVAFAVDTFHFDGEPVSPSLQILKDGFVTPLASTETGIGDGIRGSFYATVNYTPSGANDETGTLTGAIFNPAYPNNPNFSVSSVVDLSQIGSKVLGTNGAVVGHQVFYGFTASNGLADDGHFITSAIAVPVPEPSTYAMLMAGLATLTFMARRRLKHRQSA